MPDDNKDKKRFKRKRKSGRKRGAKKSILKQPFKRVGCGDALKNQSELQTQFEQLKVSNLIKLRKTT